MKKCWECKGELTKKQSKTADGVDYAFYSCSKCGDEVLDMKQLHEFAQNYKKMKKHNAKVSKWGKSLGLRIPKELAERYKIKDSSEVTIIPEDNGMRIIPVS